MRVVEQKKVLFFPLRLQNQLVGVVAGLDEGVRIAEPLPEVVQLPEMLLVA